MNKNDTITLNLPSNINSRLRDVVNENQCSILQHNMKGQQNNDINAWNCVCAIMDRIDDISKYLNKLSKKVSQGKDSFALCDLFNQSQTLIDCIYKLAKIFNIKLKNISESNTIFKQNGTDDNYFKYLRSLCSAHPISTNKHTEFQRYGSEWCPYISPANTTAMRLHCSIENIKADYFAITYTEKYEHTHFIPIKLNYVYEYLENRFHFIEYIINGITNFHNNWVNELKKKHIPTLKECNDDYVKYLCELQNAVSERLDKFQEYNVKHWIRIYNTEFSNL